MKSEELRLSQTPRFHTVHPSFASANKSVVLNAFRNRAEGLFDTSPPFEVCIVLRRKPNDLATTWNVRPSNNVTSATCIMTDTDKPKIEELAGEVALWNSYREARRVQGIDIAQLYADLAA